MRFLIIAGGAPVKAELLRMLAESSDRIVCADSGAEAARRCDIVPHTIIGDFDSVSEGTLIYFKQNRSLEVVEAYDQNTTDLEKAIIHSLSRGADEITITCATGVRSDHLLHIFGLLVKYRERTGITIVDDEDVIALRTKSFEEKCSPRERVSLIPWNGRVKGVVSGELKYPLSGEDLETGGLESVSNETTGGQFSVSFNGGMLLLIRPSSVQFSANDEG